MYRNPASGSVKFLLGFCLSIALRLLPFRPWNVEPILSIAMPFARFYGPVASFVFACVSMVLYDVIVGQMGGWTLVTSLTYGFVAMGAHYWLKYWKRPILGFASYAIIGTLVFDAVTMLSGPLFYDQPWSEAFTGQLPFTANHLFGNLLLSVTLSPLLDRFLVREPRLEAEAIFASWAVRADS